MKTREGFVSNSSSSSFCIYGTCVESINCDPEDIESRAAELGFKHIEAWSPFGDSTWVGRPYSSIRDDETGGEFRSTTEAAVNATLKSLLEEDAPKVTFDSIQESWYDG